jgi:hypothetical protein
VCGKEEVSLLILVTSSLTHSDRRLAIRETWRSQLALGQLNVKILFLLGNTAKVDDTLEEEVKTENEK